MYYADFRRLWIYALLAIAFLLLSDMFNTCMQILMFEFAAITSLFLVGVVSLIIFVAGLASIIFYQIPYTGQNWLAAESMVASVMGVLRSETK